MLLSHHLALVLDSPSRPFQSRLGRTKPLLGCVTTPRLDSVFDAYYRIYLNNGNCYRPTHSSSVNCFQIGLTSSFSLNQHPFIAPPCTPTSHFSLSWPTLVVTSLLPCTVVSNFHREHAFLHLLVFVALPSVFASVSFFPHSIAFGPWQPRSGILGRQF